MRAPLNSLRNERFLVANAWIAKAYEACGYGHDGVAVAVADRIQKQMNAKVEDGSVLLPERESVVPVAGQDSAVAGSALVVAIVTRPEGTPPARLQLPVLLQKIQDLQDTGDDRLTMPHSSAILMGKLSQEGPSSEKLCGPA